MLKLVRLTFSSRRSDGESVRQPARDAGLPEGLPADPGGEDRLLARLQHPGDPLTVQGEMHTQKRITLLIKRPKERTENVIPQSGDSRQYPKGRILSARPCGL